ncbi:MAG TPA: KH domain-containing protein [Candidatus Nanoarchaeia archaeon]|nr:KH domain-containing protein [Candidatus Nanoarchaeia archaeon]
MKKIISEKFPRILKNKRRLEKELGIKISHRGKEVFFSGNPENEYVTEKVFDALEFGFPFSVALEISNEDLMFEVINIKDHTKRSDLRSVRARIIGKNGKTLKTLSDLTKCHFELKDNQVGIIGSPEEIENAQVAVVSLIHGSKQANVYAFLEKHHPKPEGDLGLKEEE